MDCVRIEDGDLLGATANVKAMINAGRAIGDQPGLAFQAARAHAVDTAVSTLERLLAHGELPEPVLADLQKLLESEASHPLALISWRGERAAADKLFEAVRTGRAAFRVAPRTRRRQTRNAVHDANDSRKPGPTSRTE